MLSETEKTQLLCQYDSTKREYDKDKTIHQLFEEQAANTPEQTALVFGDATLTYKELNEKANQLAIDFTGKGSKARCNSRSNDKALTRNDNRNNGGAEKKQEEHTCL